MGTQPAQCRGLLHLEGLRAWFNAVLSPLKFLIILTQGSLHFHFALIPANYIVHPISGNCTVIKRGKGSLMSEQKNPTETPLGSWCNPCVVV